MNGALFYLIIPFFLTGLAGNIGINLSANIPVKDSICIEIDTVYDAFGLPDQYKGHIITPICESDKCYAVEIIFYWDLIGRFIRYDTIPGAPLTKLDHIPFQSKDYKKLYEILNNRNSVLASYSKEELVLEKRISDIDGFTGATIHEIKESVIEGAVYSCYTLWHIAHGRTSENLKTITKYNFDKHLVRKLTNMEDQAINYYLIDYFDPEDFVNYMPEILGMIEFGEGYFAKNTIENMPDIFLADNTVQTFFSAYFTQLNYFAQVSLLEKLADITLSTSLVSTLQNQLVERDSYKNELIKQLLDKKGE